MTAAAAARDAVVEALGAAPAGTSTTGKPVLRRRPGVPAKQRGRTGSAGAEDFNAKHQRQPKGRTGGGEFAAGSTGHSQQELQKQGLYHGEVDGQAGPKTSAAVKAFQKRNGLEQTGVLDQRTKATLAAPPPRSRADVIADEHKLLDPKSKAAGKAAAAGSSRAAGGVLRQGAGLDRARGNGDVKTLQAAMQDLGYDLGAPGADGKFGPLTAKAVKAFQKDHGLKVDGVIGRHTRRLLDMVRSKASTRPSKTNAPLSLDQERLSGRRAAEAAVLALCGSSLSSLPDRSRRFIDAVG